MTFGWFSVFHLLMIAALLIPNGIYMLQNKQAKNKCTSRCMNVLEQIGRYGCMLLMILSVEGGTSDDLLAIYEVGSLMCLLLYVMMRASRCTCRKLWICMALAIVMALLFLLCGITLHAWMLTAVAVIFALSHPYVTRCNVQTD